jgi:hypothetical protein
MVDKDKIISSVYYDFYGSIKDTFNEAKKKDPSIKYDDVKEWFSKNCVRKTNVKGFNSFIAQEPYQEYQIDLFFINDLDDQEYKIGLLIIDIFTKYITVVPLKTKQPEDMLDGLKTGFENMGKSPKSIYSDDEGSFNSKLLQEYFKNNNIQHIVTRGHAPYAERGIRTVKSLIYRRIEASKDNNIQWTDTKILANSLTTYNYIMKSRTHGKTPNEARDKKNTLDVKLLLEARKINKRKYPDIKVGDLVRVYTKKPNFSKERVPVWSENRFKVDKIEEKKGQGFYYLEGRERPLLRHEILLVN